MATMKSTGIVRRLDELGRITLPIELRRTMDATERDPLEIYVEENRIILQKYEQVIFSPAKKKICMTTAIKKCPRSRLSNWRN